jgi:hypothetical protein
MVYSWTAASGPKPQQFEKYHSSSKKYPGRRKKNSGVEGSCNPASEGSAQEGSGKTNENLPIDRRRIQEHPGF